MTQKKASNWKTFIEEIMVSKNGYKIVSNEVKGEIQEVTYRSSDDVPTSLTVSYFFRTSDLIAYRFSHPQMRGFNEFSKNAYFYSLQFTKPTTYGSPGIDYTDTNKKGLLSVFNKGFKGEEIQFLKDQIIVKSKLSVLEGRDTHTYQYRFTKSPMIDILINKNTNNDVGLKEEVIDLNTIFPGLIVE